MTTTRKVSLLIAFLVWACAIPGASGATIIEYHVTVNTNSLVGNSAGPFFVEFQLNDGQGIGDGNNSITINHFTYGTGGSATGMPTTLSGGASGSLASGITLTDTDPSGFNDFIQQFTPGSLLSFDITVTRNANIGGAPDLFTFAILSTDPLLPDPIPIPTTDPGFTNQLLTVSLTSSNPLVTTFAVDTMNPDTPAGIAAFQPTVVVVPEPGTTELATLGLLALAGFRRRRVARA